MSLLALLSVMVPTDPQVSPCLTFHYPATFQKHYFCQFLYPFLSCSSNSFQDFLFQLLPLASGSHLLNFRNHPFDCRFLSLVFSQTLICIMTVFLAMQQFAIDNPLASPVSYQGRRSSWDSTFSLCQVSCSTHSLVAFRTASWISHSNYLLLLLIVTC